MKWFAPAAGLFLAIAYVHFAFVAEVGGNPAWVVSWLVLFVACGGIALTHTLMRAQPGVASGGTAFGETVLIKSELLKRALMKHALRSRPLLETYDGPLLIPRPRLRTPRPARAAR